MSLVFRNYNKNDKNVCSQMMNTTWNLIDYLSKTHSTRLLNLIFSLYEKQSDYKEVALLSETNEIVGFFFAKRKIVKEKSTFSFSIIFRILFYYFGNPIWVFKFLHSLAKSEIVLFQDITINQNESSEIVAFFVNDKFQGEGIGKALLARYFLFCKENRIDEVFLITDTDCNYLFYEKNRFECIKKHPGIIGLSQDVSCKNSMFLYSKKV